jgi:hypothetical protein
MKRLRTVASMPKESYEAFGEEAVKITARDLAAKMGIAILENNLLMCNTSGIDYFGNKSVSLEAYVITPKEMLAIRNILSDMEATASDNQLNSILLLKNIFEL